MNKYVENNRYYDKAIDIMNSLYNNYLTQGYSNGILTDGMYARPRGDKPECNIWGDYFFMEAIMRLKKSDWKMYW